MSGVLVAFSVVSFLFWGAYSLREALYNGKVLQAEPDLARTNAGWVVRKWMHWALTATCFTRVVSIVVLVLVSHHEDEDVSDDDCTKVICWAVGMVRRTPDLLFLSLYSGLVFFWGQLYFATWGVSHASLQPAYFALNIVLYVTFFFIAAISLLEEDYVLLRVKVNAFFGIVYAVSLLGVIYFGIVITLQLRIKPGTAATFIETRKMVLRRVIATGFSFSLVLAAQVVTSVMAAFTWAKNLGYPGFVPDKISKLTWDILCFLVLELIPVIAILLVTGKGGIAMRTIPARRRQLSRNGSSRGMSGASLDRTDSALPLPLHASPGVQARQETQDALSARLLPTESGHQG
mmetsp:Transcript_3826/g.6748  ORF Transcript_3826/g.6748 Transcript_3826/m.6748 type:complete len:347 (+) Transcript_3826:144-1184(+)